MNSIPTIHLPAHLTAACPSLTRRKGMASWAPGWLPLLLLLLPAVVQAQFNYVTNGGTITITGYTGPGGDVTIPPTINNLPVAAIGDGAFAGSITNGNNLSSVTIPDSVTSIGGYAFAFSYNLTNVTMGNGITSIGDEAFYICTSLTQVTIPNGVTSIGQSAFDSCYSLTSVTLGNSITNIGDLCFNFCASLTNITLPDSVTGIGNYAFYDCTSLTGVVIPDKVTSIGDESFSGCSSLTNVNIPAAVTYIGSSAFDSCPNLTAITVDTLNSSYSSVDGVLFDQAQTTLLECPGGKSGAFTIPEGVTTITGYAFYECANLTSVTVPASVSSIGMEAFGSCPSLTAITVDPGNGSYYSLDGVLFEGTMLLQCPGGKSGAFTIPDGVTTIGMGAFDSCQNLTSVTIPNSVTYIGDYGFWRCPSLTAITVAALNPSYSDNDGVLFDKSQSTLIRYPGGRSGGYAIPDGVTSIGMSAFDSCANLTSVTIPASVANVFDYAFYSCPSLSRVYFEGNAPSYGEDIFWNDALTVYYLPGTTGWGVVYGGCPTQPWLPSVLTQNASFGVRTNQFGFDISWASGRTVVVEASDTLATPDWIPVGTNTLVKGSSYFSDPDWTNHPVRFYRLRSAP